MKQNHEPVMWVPKQNEDKNALFNFMRKYSISNYRHLLHVRKMVAENVIFDILEENTRLNKKLFVAPVKGTVKKPIYVKTGKQALHMAEVHLQSNRRVLQKQTSIRAKTENTDKE